MVKPRHWVLATLGAALLLAALWLLAGGADSSRCVFRRLLGVACPGCGLTRALAALLRGDWREAWRLHPLAAVFAAQGVGVWVLVGAWSLGWLPPPRRPAVERTIEGLVLANAALVVVVWLARLSFDALPQ